MVRKKRTRQHVIADLGVNYVERQILMSGHTVERVVYDYGYDLLMFTFDASGYTESGYVGLQVKATEAVLEDSDTLITLPVQRAHLIQWLSERLPVILIV